MIELVWPWMLAALPLAWLMRRFLPPETRRQTALTVPDVTPFRVHDEHQREGSRSRHVVALAMLWVAWICIVVAASRPQWTGDPVALPTSGRDLMLAVDISGSMSTEDMDLEGHLVNRLTVVKSVVDDFIDNRAGDRIGLILFGTNAYLQAPLTFDLKTVRQLLTETPVGIAGGKTAIGDAIGLAVKRLRTRPARSRVLILLTDGANNVGELAPRKAADLARRNEIRIHTIGVGNDELRLRGLFGNRIVNPSADLDEPTLQAIADITGGQYFRSRDTASLVDIYAEIDRLEPIEQDAEVMRPVRALHHVPAAIGVAVLTLLVAGAALRRD